jgi:hypothetical protein
MINLLSDVKDEVGIGSEMHKLAADLYPICRSIAGDGMRQTLSKVRERIPLNLIEVQPVGSCRSDFSGTVHQRAKPSILVPIFFSFQERLARLPGWLKIAKQRVEFGMAWC